MYYLTSDMAKNMDIERPYTNLKSYFDYKKKGIDILAANEEEIMSLGEDETNGEENS